MAVAISRSHASYIPVEEPSKIFCFPRINNIYTYYVSMFYKKSYNLLSRFDDIIRRVLESGLITKWRKDSDLKRNANQRKNDKAQDENIILTLDHISGAFIVYGIGMGIATLVFICEVIIGYYKKYKKNKVDILPPPFPYLN